MPSYTYQERIGALFVAALVTGMYLCTLVYSLRWLLFNDQGWRLRKRINWIMLVATVTLFALSSTHIILAATSTVIYIDNIVNMAPGNPRFVNAVPADPKLPWSATVMCTVTNFSVLITDGFLIYRCWQVCAKSSKSIIFPAIFWVGGLACTILQIYWQVVMSAAIPKVWVPVNMTIGPGTILTPFWGSTIVVNFYATGRIIYCIWKAAEAQKKALSPSRDLHFLIRVLLDSGMLYLLVTIPHFVVWWMPNESAGIIILGWINLPVVCSAFNLIIIRTSQYRVTGKGEAGSPDGSGILSEVHFSYPPEVDDVVDIGYRSHGKQETSITTASFSTAA
ncbi:hypothetical protein BDN70DRAFT_899007 [Pholiota conissans]|uniref:Uncharacterized protein n=1 Tax=Pholiota conissans TaxID=109636 RepID=A0A9P5YTD9_9AGAR|nr:hypothetical protein BDN70DRAFT_899007 [Pholiota conissans]